MINALKCKVMHFGSANINSPYHLYDCSLDTVSQFKDLGVTLSSPFSFKHHVASIVAKGNRLLGMVIKSFVTRDVSVVLPIYLCHVRPLLEFSSILWCPYQKTYIHQIEPVQKRFTRIFPQLRYLDYRVRLKHLGLLSLEARRLRYQLIFMYKLNNGMISIDPEYFFQFSNLSNPRRTARARVPFSRCEFRSNFFSVNVLKHWNKMLNEEVNVPSVNMFKRSVDNYFCKFDIW